MDRNRVGDMQHHKDHHGMNTPPIVSAETWATAREPRGHLSSMARPGRQISKAGFHRLERLENNTTLSQ